MIRHRPGLTGPLVPGWGFIANTTTFHLSLPAMWLEHLRARKKDKGEQEEEEEEETGEKEEEEAIEEGGRQ